MSQSTPTWPDISPAENSHTARSPAGPTDILPLHVLGIEDVGMALEIQREILRIAPRC